MVWWWWHFLVKSIFFSINMSKEVLTGIAAKRFRQLFRCCSVKCILRIFWVKWVRFFFCMIFFAKLLLTKRISDHAHTVLAFEVTSYLFFGRSLVVKMVLYSTYKTVEYVQKFKQLIILPWNWKLGFKLNFLDN